MMFTRSFWSIFHSNPQTPFLKAILDIECLCEGWQRWLFNAMTKLPSCLCMLPIRTVLLYWGEWLQRIRLQEIRKLSNGSTQQQVILEKHKEGFCEELGSMKKKISWSCVTSLTVKKCLWRLDQYHTPLGPRWGLNWTRWSRVAFWSLWQLVSGALPLPQFPRRVEKFGSVEILR